MKIIVTGSLGHISKPLATTLVQKGHAVTIISSKPEKQQEIEALGCTAAIGSLDDAGFLASAFTGADALYAMIPPSYTEPDPRAYYRRIGGNYAQAIQESGVRRVVYLSSMGAHLDKGTGLILGTHDVEGMLNGLPDVAVTHLRPGYFYYNLYTFTGMIKASGMMVANYGADDKIVMVSPADIAAVAAEEIEAPLPVKKVRYVASDERTASEVARVLGAAIGKPDLTWTTISDEHMQQGMENNGIPAHTAACFVEMFASVHSGRFWEDYQLHQPLALGKTKIEDFATEFATAFTRS